MDRPFDWEEEWEHENVDYSKPIVGQMSFFPPKFSFLNKENKIKNNFSSFEDIIFKNPAYSIGELQELAWIAEMMNTEDDCA
jgi:hypothetical protein